MIDLIQWRVTIGTWHCSSNNSKGSKREYDYDEVSHLVDEWWIGSLRLLQAILTVVVILSYSFGMFINIKYEYLIMCLCIHVYTLKIGSCMKCYPIE